MPIIHSQKLENIKPIIWYGKPVYSKYKQILQVLSTKSDSNIEDFLLVPEISQASLQGQEDAIWSSSKYSRLKKLSSFSTKVQEQLKEKLKEKVDEIISIANDFKNSDDEDEKDFGDFLELIVEIPSMDYVYSNGEDIALACWGFQSIEKENKNFKLSKTINRVDEQEIEVKEDANSQSTNSDSTTNKNKTDSNQTTENTIIVTKNDNRDWKKYFLILLFSVLVLLITGIVYYFKDTLFGYTQDVTPTDPTKVKIDEKDPMKKKIVTNRLTVMIDGVTNEQFKTIFNEKFPNSGIKVVNEEPEIQMLEFEIPEKDREKWIKDFESMKEVITAYVENVISSNYVPNDSDFNDVKKKWLFEATNTYKAWDKEKGNEDIVIAIIDGAFDLNHPELKKKNIVKPWNAATGKPILTKGTESGYRHGTHVAATAVGSIDNGNGTGGICPGCSLMPIQLSQDNMDGFSSNTVIRAMLYAIRNDADVINLSIGKTYNVDFSKMLNSDKKNLKNELRRKTVKEELKYERVFELARKKNIAIVYASGNENMYSDIDPQKRSNEILVVGAADNKNNRASFSNFGDNVTVSAPGTQIYNAVPNNNYKFLDGTSMASPIVSGLIGLMKSTNPTLPNDRIYEILVETGKEVNNTSNSYIGPLIQSDKALQEASKPYSCQDEVKRLREKLKQCKNKNMVIPKEKPKDFGFAEGIWKSTKSLSDDRTNEPIDLYFDIKKSGVGTIKLDLINKNEQCEANIKLSYSKKVLIIKQTEAAKCNKSNSKYSPYNFLCVSSGNNAAVCEAKGNNKVYFKLTKQN